VDRVVVDAHLHLWNTERLRYEWLQRPENAAINRTFGFDDFRARGAAAGVDRTVLVQADDSAADTEAMFEVSVAHPEIAGLVAWVPLDRPDEAAPPGGPVVDGRGRTRRSGVRRRAVRAGPARPPDVAATLGLDPLTAVP
jgi:predicted TIM-barrel fold metal-dependent hydrolase